MMIMQGDEEFERRYKEQVLRHSWLAYALLVATILFCVLTILLLYKQFGSVLFVFTR